jgi:hypothetical protein
MSQRNVEQVIGRLVTDEAFRRRFVEDPLVALQDAVNRGAELSILELKALIAMDPHLLARFADAIDPRLQKTDLGCSS